MLSAKTENVQEYFPPSRKNSRNPHKRCGRQSDHPGLTDLHLHAPQYSFRGMGMDLELLDWLNSVTFPEESKYSDQDYARKAYSIFAEDLKKSETTRACIFGTLHVEATDILMALLEKPV